MDGAANPHDILKVLGERPWLATWSTKSRRCTASRV
jgi:glycyl-tRNA synthetase alpha subunit